NLPNQSAVDSLLPTVWSLSAELLPLPCEAGGSGGRNLPHWTASGEAVEIASAAGSASIQAGRVAEAELLRCMFRRQDEDGDAQSACSSLRKGKEWIGSANSRKRKSGATFQHLVLCILPIRAEARVAAVLLSEGQLRISIYVKHSPVTQTGGRAADGEPPPAANPKDSAASGHDKVAEEHLSGRHNAAEGIAPWSGGGGGGGGKTAASRIGFQPDLPMQKVLGLLGQARDGSQSPAAAAALDRALELLRQAGGDQQQPRWTLAIGMASDYVGGLMTAAQNRGDKKRSSLQARRYHRPSEIMAEQISRVLRSGAVFYNFPELSQFKNF
uniref:Kinesin motor domain-containing protein n=1 Tax=Macrostomum lignano TaxID=282301 RepID=A0A1I8FRT2_9PLAT